MMSGPQSFLFFFQHSSTHTHGYTLPQEHIQHSPENITQPHAKNTTPNKIEAKDEKIITVCGLLLLVAALVNCPDVVVVALFDCPML